MASRNKDIQGQVDPILTTFAAGYAPMSAKMIARKVAPIIPSLTNSGTLFSFGKEGFMLYDTERALRANAKKIEFAISKSTYRTAEHALESSLDYEEIKDAQKYGAAEILKLEQRAVMLSQNALETELEYLLSQVLFGTSYYATGNKETLTTTDQWSDYANSDHVSQVKDGKSAARADMGIDPNTMVLGYESWKLLRDHPLIIERVKYSQLAILTPQLVAQVFDLDNIIVGGSVYAGDDGVFSDLWGDSAALVYMPAQGELTEGTTPHSVVIEEKGYPQVKVYGMKKTKDYETTRKYVVKNISTSNGYLFLDTKAA